MSKPVYMVPGGGSPFEFSLNLLMSGNQSYEAFRIVAAHFSENAETPDNIKNEALQWAALAFSKILNGESPTKALGMSRQIGRSKDSFVLSTKVSAFIEMQKRKGLTKNRSIQLAASTYHRDTRHIQRLISQLRIDFSEMEDKAVASIMNEGIDLRFLGPTENLE